MATPPPKKKWILCPTEAVVSGFANGLIKKKERGGKMAHAAAV